MYRLTILYNFFISCWLGGAALFTFLLTPEIFNAFSRDMASDIVGILFPSYFRWGLLCGLLALPCCIFHKRRYYKITLFLLVLLLGITIAQAFFIEPQAATLKQTIVSFDATPKTDPARIEFSKLHRVSMALNVLVILGVAALNILSSLASQARSKRKWLFH